MDFELKRKEKASFNYTDRSLISLKSISVEVIKQIENEIELNVELDLDKILISNDNYITIEAFYRGGFYRRQKLVNPQKTNRVVFHGFPSDADLTLRVLLLPSIGSSDGKILKATKSFSLHYKNRPPKTKNILDFELDNDIGDQVWRVDWSDKQNPIIKIKKTVNDKYDIKTDIRFHAIIIPSILREILIGIFMRFDDIDQIDEKSGAKIWLRFFDERLPTWSLPDEEDWDEKERLLELAEDAIQTFCSKKWINGKRTLLEAFLDQTWKLT